MPKYQVRVQALSSEEVPLVKSLRLIADLGLREATSLGDALSASLPCLLVVGIDEDVAQHIVTLLEAAGASATLEESSLTEPMLFCPQANRRYEWHWLSGPTLLEPASN